MGNCRGGLVISGEYFDWNYGWAVAGPLGFLLAHAHARDAVYATLDMPRLLAELA